MTSSSSTTYLPLMMIGVFSLAAVKIPDGVSALKFYSISVLIAVCLAALIIGCLHSVKVRFATGIGVVFLLLAQAVFVVINLEPYFAPIK